MGRLSHAFNPCHWTHLLRGPFSVVFIVVAILSIVSIIIAIIGTVLYVIETENRVYFRGPVEGKLLKGLVLTEQCSSEHCTGTTDHRHCHTYYYTCYRAAWQLEYTALNAPDGDGSKHIGKVSDDTTSNFYSTAASKANKYSPDSEHNVWYDTRDYEKLRWKQPDPRAYFLMMVICFSLAGPCVLFSIFTACYRFATYGGYDSL